MNKKLKLIDYIFAIGGGITTYFAWEQGFEALVIGILMFIALLAYYLMLKNNNE